MAVDTYYQGRVGITRSRRAGIMLLAPHNSTARTGAMFWYQEVFIIGDFSKVMRTLDTALSQTAFCEQQSGPKNTLFTIH
ncbi:MULTISPECIES: hypothetical protein [unclassified Janthinobacterium]|uniref:hypothetical protein n=1 Tax=unclassified Janthinobacterium TaxID=2610881 RepID=UPI0018CBD208|nr:hypothetical protein [Janthinobacterium sp. CG_23.4]MDH6155962.1 hypothetical protein [Janthinobacterium sp. CG_23.4]